MWAPYPSYGNKGSLQAQEGPLRAFTKRAQGMNDENYWCRLQKFKLLSIQRRFERYRCLYIWKILNGKVPDCGLLKLSTVRSTRSNVNIVPITLDGYFESFKSKQRDSLLHSGVILYNSLPVLIRNITGDLNDFKQELDRLLEVIPDQPVLPGYVPRAKDMKGKPSNSIIDWLRIIDTSQLFLTINADD